MPAISLLVVFLAQVFGAALDPILLGLMVVSGLTAPRWWVLLIPAAVLAALDLFLRDQAGQAWAAPNFLGTLMAAMLVGLTVYGVRRTIRRSRSVAP